VIHTRFLGQLDEDPERAIEDPHELVLFERAVKLYRELADVRGEAEALFWIGCFHQVVRRDDRTAVPILERSRELAAQVGDKGTMSEALRHLGIAEHRAGHLDGARERLEESTRLRREIGLMPGVAANLVGQAYIAAADDRRDYARTLLSEAAAIADATGAHRITRQVDEARADLYLPEPGDSADEGFEHGGSVEGPEPQVVGQGGFLEGGHAVQGGPEQPGVGAGVVAGALAGGYAVPDGPLDEREGTEDRISCPNFVCSAEDDDLSADAGKLYDALTCPKRYYRFPSAEGAGEHCESGARTLFHQFAFDWLGQVLNPGGQAAERAVTDRRR
jgi:hypothetical protein